MDYPVLPVRRARMAKLVPAALAGALLMGIAATSSAAEPEVCVTDGATPCGSVGWPDADGSALGNDTATAALEAAPADQAASVPVGPAPAGQAPIGTRTLAPPTVVNAFSGSAAPAVAQGEAQRRAEQPEHQHLPPGPANRFP